jgi:hypothetical protein
MQFFPHLSINFPAVSARRMHIIVDLLLAIALLYLAWPLASIPIYYWRHRLMLEEQRIRTLAGGHMVAPRKYWG